MKALGLMKTLMVAALGMTALAADTQSPDALASAIKLGQRPVAIDMIAKMRPKPTARRRYCGPRT